MLNTSKMTIVDIGKIAIFTCLIIKVGSIDISRNSSEYNTYRCKSGVYVPNKIVCSGSEHAKHCGDPPDDFNGCDRKKCGIGKFKCTEDNSTCLDITARCNTIKDCLNGTDELNCGDETKIDDCSFYRGKFLCEDKLKCLDLELTCDGSCNCFDCSDENSNCTKTENSSNEKCPISYFNTPKGAQCFCDPNNKQLDELCQEVEDCSFEYRCSQRCSKYKSKISCSCYESYNEVHGSKGSKCESNASQADTLLYSTSNKIKALNIASLKTSVLVNQVESASLTAARNYLYFTTYRDYRKAIHASAIGSQISAPLIEWNSTITSIAADYITNNIYFTASDSLLVCSNDSRICKKLKCCEVDLIALAPKSGLMFYTTKTSRDDDRFIMKSDMDGSNEVILVDSSFQTPTALTVDELAEKLYWIDQNRLYLASFNGFFKQLALDSFSSYGNELPLSLAVSRKNVYVGEKGNNYIRTIAYKKTNPNKGYQDVYTTSVELLFLYNPLQQDIFKTKNPCNVTSCATGLCLLRPASLSSATLTFSCV